MVPPQQCVDLVTGLVQLGVYHLDPRDLIRIIGIDRIDGREQIYDPAKMVEERTKFFDACGVDHRSCS